MTPRERALLLRLAAAIESGDSPRSAENLRQTLRDEYGWTDAAIDAPVARATAAVALLAQTRMFEQAA